MEIVKFLSISDSAISKVIASMSKKVEIHHTVLNVLLSVRLACLSLLHLGLFVWWCLVGMFVFYMLVYYLHVEVLGLLRCWLQLALCLGV